MQEVISKIYDNERFVLKEYAQKQFIDRWFKKNIYRWDKIIGIVGLRWVGKTSFLLSLRQKDLKWLYISLDRWFFSQVDIFELIKELYKTYWITTFYLDEIHYYTGREQTLKNIHDVLPVKIIFSGSSMIQITGWWYDLSRRVVLYDMFPFSFREYILMTKWYLLPKLTLQDIITNHSKIAKEHTDIFSQSLFLDYLKYWQFGYGYQDRETFDRKLENAIKKSIYEDFVPNVDYKTENPKKLEDILTFLCNSAFSEISTNNISGKVWLNIRTTEVYLEHLARLGRLQLLDKYDWHITNIIRKSKKIIILCSNIIHIKNLWLEQSKLTWNTRESFFALCIKRLLNSKNHIYYQSQTDFVLELDDKKYFFEIWWKWKSRSDYNLFIIKDDITIWEWNNIPLWLFGLL